MPLGFKLSEDDRSSTHPVHHFDRRVLSVRLGWFGLLLGLCLGLSWYLTHTLVLYGASIERNAMLAIASAAASTFDGGAVKEFEGKADDQTDPAFIKLREELQRTKAGIPESRFAYLMARRNADIVFLADAEPSNSKDYSPPGEVYDEATDALRGVFVTKKPAVEGPVSDRWGDWVSGLAPIIDPGTGNVVAVFGFDINAKNWNATIARFRWLGITISSLVAAVILLFGLFSYRQHALAAKIHHSARHDPLTGLLNRKIFVERVQQTISERRGEGVAVLYLDLDHFKDVNDTLGHSVGDELLRSVAERLRINLRRGDCVGRIGGDEFAVMIKAKNVSTEAHVMAARLIAAMREPFESGANNIRSDASIGIAICNYRDEDAEKLLSYADIALYGAKNDGRGRYKVFTNDMDVEVRERVTLSTEIRQALECGQLFLEYQPQIEIKTRRIAGVEALVRWRHPKRGTLQPEEFVPAAERSGLLVQIDRWVIREACRQGKAWLDAGIAPDRIAVNVSALHFTRPRDLERDILAALNDTGLPPERLEIELTESGLMAASSEQEGVLSELRQKGVSLAIDDFGTGYCSLDYLRRYPADRVKIARAFVAQIGSDPGSAVIVKAIAALSRELGMAAIAEGIETSEQLQIIEECMCPEAQGFFFSVPLSPRNIFPLLRQGTIIDAPTTDAKSRAAPRLAVVGRR